MNKICERCPAKAGCNLVRGGNACKKVASRFGFNPKPRQIDRIQAMGAETLAHFLDNYEDTLCMICEKHCPKHREDGLCPAEIQEKYCHQATINYLMSYVGEENDLI